MVQNELFWKYQKPSRLQNCIRIKRFLFLTSLGVHPALGTQPCDEAFSNLQVEIE